MSFISFRDVNFCLYLEGAVRREWEDKQCERSEQLWKAHVYVHVICILIYFIKCFVSFVFTSRAASPLTGQWLLLFYHCVMGARYAFRILIFFRRAIWLAHSPSLNYFPVRSLSSFVCVRFPPRFSTDGWRCSTQTHILRKSPYGIIQQRFSPLVSSILNPYV